MVYSSLNVNQYYGTRVGSLYSSRKIEQRQSIKDWLLSLTEHQMRKTKYMRLICKPYRVSNEKDKVYEIDLQAL